MKTIITLILVVCLSPTNLCADDKSGVSGTPPLFTSIKLAYVDDAGRKWPVRQSAMQQRMAYQKAANLALATSDATTRSAHQSADRRQLQTKLAVRETPQLSQTRRLRFATLSDSPESTGSRRIQSSPVQLGRAVVEPRPFTLDSRVQMRRVF